MILFTGGGSFAQKFKELFTCTIISARNLDDISLVEYLSKANIIIHNSAIIKGNSFKEFIEGNFLLTKRILDLANEINPNVRFINISSMSILDNDVDYLSTHLMSDYAFSKFISEQYCLKHFHQNLINVRFSTIFFENFKKDGFSKLILDSFSDKITIYNSGLAERDVIPLRIAVQYLNKLCYSDLQSKIVNIASGSALSFNYLSSLILKLNDKVVIQNIECELAEILKTFSKKDIIRLGEIEFSIEEEFTNYYKKLNESFNLQ